MSLREAGRWVAWLAGGGLLGAFILFAAAFLWCLPYMTVQSYCTGDAPFVGFMLVAASPFAILLGAYIAGVMLSKRNLRETLKRQAEELKELERTKADEPPPSEPHA
jgi:hypothetical protein